MRALLVLAAAALCCSSAALAQTAKPIEIRSIGNLSIKADRLPAGCKVQSGLNSDGDWGQITCDTQTQLEQGFTISGGLKKKCEPDSKGKYVCRLTDA